MDSSGVGRLSPLPLPASPRSLGPFCPGFSSPQTNPTCEAFFCDSRGLESGGGGGSGAGGGRGLVVGWMVGCEEKKINKKETNQTKRRKGGGEELRFLEGRKERRERKKKKSPATEKKQRRKRRRRWRWRKKKRQLRTVEPVRFHTTVVPVWSRFPRRVCFHPSVVTRTRRKQEREGA